MAQNSTESLSLSVTCRKIGDDSLVLWSRIGFEIREPATASRLAAFLVRLDQDAANAVSKSKASLGKQRIEEAIVRWAMQRIDTLVQEYGPSLPVPASTEDVIILKISEGDLPLITEYVNKKRCDYQRPDGRDLLCSAAWKGADSTIVSTEYGRPLAPTSRALCLRCELPDTDYLCSHLHHPKVVGEVVSQEKSPRPAFERRLCGAFCDLNREELGTGAKCHPGGNSCWERLVDLAASAPVLPYSPRELPTALDFLGAVWRSAFPDRGLFNPKNIEATVAIALPCDSRDEFVARLSDLADLFKLMTVPDELLPESKRGKTETLPKDATFDRIFLALSHKFGHLDAAAVKAGIRPLRAVNRARRSLQHSALAPEFAEAMLELGIGYPIADYGKAWDAVRSKAAEGVGLIRKAIQTALA